MTSENETVVLLHGIGHSMMNMLFLEQFLKKQGYKTYNITYPSLKKNIEALTRFLSDQLNKKRVWENSDKVHFVVHSMGGLVSGFYLQDFKDNIPADKLGRVVMLGTPHGGSEVADALENLWPYKRVFGPAGQELTTRARKGNKIDPYYDLGIIAGSWGKLHPMALFMKSEHDGCVSVESTQIPGMRDHIVMPVSHSLMGWNLKVKNQVIYFIENGEFHHAR